jgi:hypothetical protein
MVVTSQNATPRKLTQSLADDCGRIRVGMEVDAILEREVVESGHFGFSLIFVTPPKLFCRLHAKIKCAGSFKFVGTLKDCISNYRCKYV